MADLFISYTRADSGIVEQVESLLKKTKIDIWRDTVAMPYAVNWDDAVIEALCHSSYAVIFDSLSRQKKFERPNSAVQREAEWIKEIHIPCLTVDLEEIYEPQVIAKKILQWMNDEKRQYGKSNAALKTIISGAYAYKNHTVSFEKNDIPRGIFGKAAKLFELFCYKKELENNPDFGCGSLELRQPIFGFIKQYKKRITRGLLMQLTLLVTVALTIGFGAWSGIEFYKTYTQSQYMTKLVTSKGLISRAYDSDAILGASYLNSESIESKYVLFSNYTRLLGSKYPTEYYEATTEASVATNLQKNNNELYSIKINPNDGVIYIEDNNGFCNQFVVDGIPSDYDFSEDGKCVAVSVANKVFLYYLGGVYSPEELKGSYEDIDKVFINNQKVFAITKKSNVVVWDIFSNQTRKLDYNISAGHITSINGATAAFISDSMLVLNSNDSVKEIPLPSEFRCAERNLAISHNGLKIALVGLDSQGNSLLYEYAIDSDKFELIYSSDHYLSAVDYSFDDSSILFGDRSELNLKEINLDSKKVKGSKKVRDYIYTIRSYEDGCIIGLADGTLTPVGNDLAISSHYSDVAYGNIPRQIAVSGSTGTYFAVSRNANNLGSAVYYISGAGRQTLIDTEMAETCANSAVAVSEDGFVAYGNDDGRISIWSIENILPVWINKDIKEGIVDMSFTQGGKSLLVLGTSGTVYSVALPSHIADCAGNDYSSQLDMLRKQAKSIYERISGLGLTDITLDQFLLKERYFVSEN